MEPSPKAAEEEDEDGGGVDESEALLGSKKKGEKTPGIVPLKVPGISREFPGNAEAVRIVPSNRDAVKVSAGEPAKPKVKKPYLNTDV